MFAQPLAAWLALYFTPGIGPKTFHKLLAHDSPVNIVTATSTAMQALGLTIKQREFLRHRALSEVEPCLEWQQAASAHRILLHTDSGYPQQLRQVSAAPAVLFVKGKVEALSLPQLAIVGSRNASLDALNSARGFAKALVEQQLAVTSGLALGVDGYAHDGALQAAGSTLAVLGCGLNHLYPARHRDLAERIVAGGGALISEFHPNAKPKADHFPRRNRIISGLSLGVLVVEAAQKSGSLITARYALEQGREVFALPGSIHNPQATGCNLLIKQGACLVLSVEDILNELHSLLDWSSQTQLPLFEQEIATKQQLPFASLLANVGSKATPVDILANRTNIPVQEVMMQLLELELLGHVVAVTGGYIRKGRG
ncbi:DNA-protecting protein DprA [Vibrio sp. JPW-9-11-11]|uniref:DNA-processing protein DprA n=1 Tax=Vibrio sp. JPW-9-11-11 TaxID=1416532 RepID=UPI001593092E|nr:DNA-processing protein DprA [Vibrio sp. JPW-9-11-11]NVD05887.1 DNA-protecting protein DprA [Vibrio sp. JPW-9-11-11]